MPGCCSRPFAHSARDSAHLPRYGPLAQVRVVKHAFDIIHLLTDQNPIQVVVDAIINRCGAVCVCVWLRIAQRACRAACT